MCKSKLKINSHLISHLNIFHDVKSISEFKCLETGCYRVLHTFHSFKNHKGQHKDVLVENNKPDNFPRLHIYRTCRFKYCQFAHFEWNYFLKF